MQAFVAASEPDPVNQIPDPGEGHMNGDSKQPKSILKKKERIKSILKSNKKEEPSSSNKEKSENEKTDKVPQDKNAVEDVDEKLKDFLAVRVFHRWTGSPAGDYNLHHVCAYVCACVGHTVFSETTTVTHFW